MADMTPITASIDGASYTFRLLSADIPVLTYKNDAEDSGGLVGGAAIRRTATPRGRRERDRSCCSSAGAGRALAGAAVPIVTAGVALMREIAEVAGCRVPPERLQRRGKLYFGVKAVLRYSARQFHR
jgi:hypothetical protein